MTLIVQCQTCGRELRSQDRYAGMCVRCPQCGELSQLPTEPVELPASAICFLCGKDFAADPDLVKDTGGRYYHRRCYEDASRYEQARRSEKTRRHTSPTARRTTANTEEAPPGILESESLGEVEPTVDDLWKDLLAPDSTASADAAWHSPPAPRRNTAWLYVMMGFSAAVPAVVLLFILVQLIVNSLEGKRESRRVPPMPPVISGPKDAAATPLPTGKPSAEAAVKELPIAVGGNRAKSSAPGPTGQTNSKDTSTLKAPSEPIKQPPKGN